MKTRDDDTPETILKRYMVANTFTFGDEEKIQDAFCLLQIKFKTGSNIIYLQEVLNKLGSTLKLNHKTTTYMRTYPYDGEAGTPPNPDP